MSYEGDFRKFPSFFLQRQTGTLNSIFYYKKIMSP